MQSEAKRFVMFGLWLCAAGGLFFRPLEALVRYSLGNDNASHIVLIPLISAWVLYFEQKRIFQKPAYDYVSGGLLLLASLGVGIWTLRQGSTWTETQVLSGYTLALVLLWMAGFALIFGRTALRNGRFALLFLLLMIPPPEYWLNYSVYLLQKGSADIAEWIFDLAGVPALRDGFVFHLAHLSIEVAKECSGIRSSLALLILALLVGHLFLRTFWKQVVFVVVGLVIMIVKNGIRIATLTILAQYVDSGFLYGRLHHEGGVVFFLIGLVLLLPVFWLLQRGETPRPAERDGLAG
jgi:exosortase